MKGHRLYNSPAYKKILGYSTEELQTTSAFQQIHPDDRQKVFEATEQAHATGVGKRLEYRIQHKDGSWRVLESTSSPVCNELGQVEKLVIVNRDITERKHAEQKLEHTALHDALTDLPNRAMFRDRLQRSFDRAQKDPSYRFAVLFVDIDGFKVFNDSMGHSVGDEILIEISRRLENCLRFEDRVFRPAGSVVQVSLDETLARLGGDEFTILVGSIQDPSDAIRVAKRIQEALGTVHVNGRQIFISASIGIALSSTPHATAEEMLRDADIAMYRAKKLGKSRCEFFDAEMHSQAVQQLDLETELRRAVSEEQFRLHYQPIVHLETGKIAGFEALVRWQRSHECLVFPDSFISTAEGIGLVVPLGKWVLRQACRQSQIWREIQPQARPLSITVNLSPRQFVHRLLVADIKEVLHETGINPERLHIEITESATMSDPVKTKQVLAELKNLGIGICMDDFGTGHSSLDRLRKFPVDILKIDRSFVAHIDIDPAARAIVRLIVEFAHAIDLKVIAEGVETPGHLNLLRSLGCEFGQGFFFSKAVDDQTALQLLAQQGEAGRPAWDHPSDKDSSFFTHYAGG